MTGGFFAILDDIGVLLDDTAAMSKVAVKKTAGVLGDDLAVNAEKAAGFHASRELPILWAITKGSFRNKVILLPLAFLLSAFAPSWIIPILLVGGVYLCFEGAEKMYDYFFPLQHPSKPLAETVEDEEDLLAGENKKIKSAILTDFILSIEIIVIALGTVAHQSLMMQVTIVSLVAVLATIGVYGIVAFIVRMDDMGFGLIQISQRFFGWRQFAYQKMGDVLVSSLPKVIKALAVIGTIAMLLVGGGIFVHNIKPLHHLLESFPMLIAELSSGLVVGFMALGAEKLLSPLFHKGS
jgi:predicted DNA repair protein MutK